MDTHFHWPCLGIGEVRGEGGPVGVDWGKAALSFIATPDAISLDVTRHHRVSILHRPFSMISFAFDWNRFKILIKKKKILKNPEMSNYYVYVIRKFHGQLLH